MFVWRAFEDVPLGEEVEFETFYYVAERQPIPKLVGFKRDMERDFFRKLMTVPKVGPTKALKALVYSVSVIANWIESGNAASLAHLPGVGKRTADTIIASLKGKVYLEALLRDEAYVDVPEGEDVGPISLDDVTSDAMEGLVNLGYGRGEAARLVEEIVKDQALRSVEEVIMAVFQKMQKS
jgi:holliday junction DNA helicase RuvA